MGIKKLAPYIINKLKAGEVVERPSSVVKELIENSLDAGANDIILEISNGGKSFIKVEDNGFGISQEDLELSIQSYATSKIKSDEDLLDISSFGFRGEALSTISEVSKFTIQTKSTNDTVANQLIKIDKNISIKQIAFDKEHGTKVLVQDLFFNVPARQKFLKTETTEYNYILDIFLNFVIQNYDKKFRLIKNGKIIKNFNKVNDCLTRLLQVYKESWKNNIKILENEFNKISIFGVASDSTLTFSSPSNIKIFVNNRPVQDKIIKKAILDFYKRQISPGQFPLAIIFLQIDGSLVDVNVHPRKQEVKFQDPNSIFNLITQTLSSCFSSEKVSSASLNYQKDYQNNFVNKSYNSGFNNNFYKSGFAEPKSNYGSSFNFPEQTNIYSKSNFDGVQNNSIINNNFQEFQVIGQIWNSFIILQGENELYFVDQHALAERIAFEKMKKDMTENNLEPEIILNPISIQVPKNINTDQKIEQLNNLGFDISMIGEDSIAIYSVPKIFIKYNIDLEKVIDKIIYSENISLDSIFDEIFATKACKTSIKAGDKLSIPEMVNLINDGYKNIDKMFVCQHGRPSIVNISKENIEKLFDR
ncbi:DNA mismatch repair endonuclease MutL [Candidatus Vampirococcus lugosii]|uniref:DNA mismatch repair protein MutL n=1 Tax=Candidatus Vampirococcus lugosii TaxID=2789015 RepID=A0ABS5QMK7_9BACT|nr:DNA mismatch repair protein MutL [Candidatus Vampirococcus lugosii]